ncbi:hypothetical protein JR316_0009452 [Psilocybe cubensis]|uniref:Uncharacterized protein n=1 Tax=Psilocybe cubensis TaxID=181762 RepID=A0ACB8GTS1_PSICU|nr:hypothetical protein JR316_0009452 [Psilocybe cubensis]KAH9478989.1 hypothetical protein JR316_0009452 [Psilocybe cubensis]
MSGDGKQLAIAYGLDVALVNNPFERTLVSLAVPRHASTLYLMDYPIPRGLYFLDNDHILVVFFGQCGIIAFSRHTNRPAWSIPISSNSLVASSALSPSGERLAIKTVNHTIEWYSISHQKRLSTTVISRRNDIANSLVDMTFLDEDTVIVGHDSGCVILASYGMEDPTGIFNTDDFECMPIQALTCGVPKGTERPLILAVARRMLPDTLDFAYNSVIHVGEIDTPAQLPYYQPTMDSDKDRSGAESKKFESLLYSNLPLATIVGVAGMAIFFGVRLLSNPTDTGPTIVTPSFATNTLYSTVTETAHVSAHAENITWFVTQVETSHFTVTTTAHSTSTETAYSTETVQSTVTETITSENKVTDILTRFVPASTTATSTSTITSTAVVQCDTGVSCICPLSGTIEAVATPRGA